MFLIARGAIIKLMSASVFVYALDNLWAISEAGNILLNRTQVQSAVVYLRCTYYDVSWYEMQTHFLPQMQHHLICLAMQ